MKKAILTSVLAVVSLLALLPLPAAADDGRGPGQPGKERTPTEAAPAAPAGTLGTADELKPVIIRFTGRPGAR